MKITQTALPNESLLYNNNKTYDYVDSYQAAFIDKADKVKAVDIGKAFFSSAPKWVDKLFILRNKIVSRLGLKTSGSANKQQILDDFKCEKGEQVGLFKVFDRSDNEIILGEDDRHLNFRVSLFWDNFQNAETQKRLTISTTVTFSNWFGRLYFLPVRPFHKLIVPTMLKRMIKQLET